MIILIIFFILLIWCIYRNYVVYNFIQKNKKTVDSVNTKRLFRCKSYEDLIECIEINAELFSFKRLYLKNILSKEDLNKYYELTNI